MDGRPAPGTLRGHDGRRARKQSSRGAPRGAPLSHHRTYGSRITAVSDKVQRGILLPRQGSFMIPCRRRLWLLSRPRSGSAFPAGAVAQRGLQGFVEKVPLVRAALLPLHVHRLVQAAPCLSNSALRPVARTTMASADFSRPIGGRRRPPAPIVWRDREISQGKTLILPSSAAGFTCARVRLAFGLPRPLPGYPTAPASYPVPVRQLRVLPPASSPLCIAATQLPSANGSGQSARRGLAPPRSAPCLAHSRGYRHSPA